MSEVEVTFDAVDAVANEIVALNIDAEDMQDTDVLLLPPQNAGVVVQQDPQQAFDFATQRYNQRVRKEQRIQATKEALEAAQAAADESGLELVLERDHRSKDKRNVAELAVGQVVYVHPSPTSAAYHYVVAETPAITLYNKDVAMMEARSLKRVSMVCRQMDELEFIAKSNTHFVRENAAQHRANKAEELENARNIAVVEVSKLRGQRYAYSAHQPKVTQGDVHAALEAIESKYGYVRGDAYKAPRTRTAGKKQNADQAPRTSKKKNADQE